MHISDGATCAKVFRDLRARAGLSLREVAAGSGVCASTWSRVEAGWLPQTKTLIVMLNFYGVTVTVGYTPQFDPEPEILT